ncbi:melatonin receptor type 1B-A-like isoform X2 [Cimex lectularius]|uniref:G-protein coupled receptors family 1 profile domain-containing protein n=1 Tax=Cimex lectularius TaxID=79782 RepID=A0A8I6SGA3_CIMLE|nr:melatonin receptor type 1B-A-like isoform X2 [Cimex lectularius]
MLTGLAQLKMEKMVLNRFNESDGWGEINPVTLSSDWSRVARLLTLAGLSVVGSLGNVYMISAVMIEDHLKKRGNTFIVNVALADLLITGVVMPASAIVILAGLDPATEVCNVQWFLAILSWLVTVLSLAATAAENYSRLCLSPETYARLTTRRVTIIVLSIWAVSIIVVTIQQIFNVGPSYCKRPSGILLYQAMTASIFFILPALLTTFYYAKTIMQVRLARTHPSFKPPVAFGWDYSLMKTNMYSFCLFFLFWVPFGVILFIDSVKSISPKLFYNLAWIALSKSCVNNFLYCILDRHFRSAYINLFHYCCCKTTVTFSRRTREVARPSGDVRVHIIPGYNMYSYTSPQRSGRECTKVTSGKRTSANRPPRPHHNRDVYEL